MREAQAAKRALEAVRTRLVHRELDELDAPARRARRQRRRSPARRARGPAQLVQHEDQRAMAVDRDAARRAGAEPVVEDLERQQPVVAGGLQRAA